MNLLDLLKGKTITVKTGVGVEVDLIIESVTADRHTQDLEPSTAANDWWPAQREWTTYTVKFTNGHSKTYNSINEIKIKE